MLACLGGFSTEETVICLYILILIECRILRTEYFGLQKKILKVKKMEKSEKQTIYVVYYSLVMEQNDWLVNARSILKGICRSYLVPV